MTKLFSLIITFLMCQTMFAQTPYNPTPQNYAAVNVGNDSDAIQQLRHIRHHTV